MGFLFFRLWGTLLKLKTDAYGADGNDPYVSPLLHKKLGALPKVYIAVAGQDTLRDDGRLLKAALDGAEYVDEASHFRKSITDISSVPNLYHEYTGYPHWFWAFPSEYLAVPIAEYGKNLKKGFEFILA